MPFAGDFEKFSDGASHLVSTDRSLRDSSEYFERKIIESFLSKLEAGIDIPNYPQFRDMNKMFFEMMDGIERLKGGYVETGVISQRSSKAEIPEVLALRRNSKEIYERTGGTFRVKICITGPYTLSSFFRYRDPEIYGRLGDALSKIADGNMFDDKHGGVRILAVDEPVFGSKDDPQMDVGSAGRENLLQSWEGICRKARQKGVETCFHLHSTTDELVWQVDSLGIVESHVGDPLYSTESTKRLLESTDKMLKASICITIFDKLIEKHVLSRSKDIEKMDITGKIGQVWEEIREGKTVPDTFIEDAETMERRLREIVGRFGSERVPYAGSECGLRSFPTYECAVECLRRASTATKVFDRQPP